MHIQDDFQVFEVGNSVHSKIDSGLQGTIEVYSSGAIGIRRNDGTFAAFHEAEFYQEFELDRWDRCKIQPCLLYDA
jgi:hypothetical protein